MSFREFGPFLGNFGARYTWRAPDEAEETSGSIF